MHCGVEVTESSTNKQHHLSRVVVHIPTTTNCGRFLHVSRPTVLPSARACCACINHMRVAGNTLEESCCRGRLCRCVERRPWLLLVTSDRASLVPRTMTPLVDHGAPPHPSSGSPPFFDTAPEPVYQGVAIVALPASVVVLVVGEAVAWEGVLVLDEGEGSCVVSAGVSCLVSAGVSCIVSWGCVFITAGPIIKLCAGGEGDSEGHVL
jgi:hypothetical protein